jgi:hypothetical protein
VALLAALLVALAMLLEAPLVREAREELRLEAAEPVAVAREELSAEDREARSELAEEETEETTEESEEETLLADEASELLTEAPAEAAEEVSEETTLESELATELAASCVVVVWACNQTVSGLDLGAFEASSNVRQPGRRLPGGHWQW